MQRSCIIEISYIIIRIFLKTALFSLIWTINQSLCSLRMLSVKLLRVMDRTYGGILTSNKMTAELMLEIVELLIKN